MLAVPIEENQARKYDESFYDENLDKILNCLKLADQLGSEPRMMQVRITAFVNSDMLLSLSRLAVTPSMVRTFHQALVTCDEGAIAATLSDDDNVDSGSLLRALERLYTFVKNGGSICFDRFHVRRQMYPLISPGLQRIKRENSDRC